MKRTAIVLSLIIASVAGATIMWPSVKYGQQVTIYFELYDSSDPNTAYGTAPAADDVYIRKDGGTAARATNAVTDLGRYMSLVLTATEMQCAVATIDVNDESSPKLYGDELIIVPTFGHASALQAFDLDDAAPPVDVTTWDGNDITKYAYNTTTKMLNVDVNYVRESAPMINPGEGNFTRAMRGVMEATIDDDPNTGSVFELAQAYLTGDAFDRLGAPAGASASADIAAIKALADSIAALTTKLDTMLAASDDNYQFTPDSIENTSGSTGGTTGRY